MHEHIFSNRSCVSCHAYITVGSGSYHVSRVPVFMHTRRMSRTLGMRLDHSLPCVHSRVYCRLFKYNAGTRALDLQCIKSRARTQGMPDKTCQCMQSSVHWHTLAFTQDSREIVPTSQSGPPQHALRAYNTSSATLHEDHQRSAKFRTAGNSALQKLGFSVSEIQNLNKSNISVEKRLKHQQIQKFTS